MKKHPNLCFFSLLVILFSRTAFAQAGYQAAPGDAKTAEFQGKIARTAAELGISVYEDYPVAASSAQQPQPVIVFDKAARQPVFSMPSLANPEPVVVPVTATDMPIGNKWGYLTVAYHTICAQIIDSGVLPWKDGAYSFQEISEKAIGAVKSTKFGARRAGQASLLRDEGYIKEIEALTGAAFTDGGTAEFLVNGAVSFPVKDRLMREAKKSIYVATYAIYDDITGNETTEILLAKKKEGVDIKFMVDEKMAHVFGGKNLKRMAAAGIDILRYADSRGHDYLHVKMLLVDGEYGIVGGMNYGDPYSQKNPNGLKWRDTDVLYTGPAVADSVKIFAGMWNQQVKDPARQVAPASYARGSGQARISVTMQNPPTLTPPILLSILKGIYGATERVNIENAYIVAIPALVQAVRDATARGVEVNILTNSKESIDSDGKSFADSILKSMKVFAEAGAHVYLKQGETLHSKFMTVDGVYCSIGSYNLHPRSERYDTELNVNILDAASVARLDAAYAADLAAARKVSARDLGAKPGWLSRIMDKYFYSQLGR